MSLRLDPAIAAWVMAPLLVLVMLVNYARMYAMRLVQPAPDAGGDKKQLQYRNVLARAARLRAFGGLISQAGWQMRHEWLLAPVVGKLHDKNVADANPMDAVGGSNSGMMDNMKGMVRRREEGGLLNEAPGFANPPSRPPPPPRCSTWPHKWAWEC